jgi:hypothetical protein
MRDDELEHYRRQAIAALDHAIVRLRQRVNATNPDGSPNTKVRKDAAHQLRHAQRFRSNARLHGDAAAETAPTPGKHLRSV